MKKGQSAIKTSPVLIRLMAETGFYLGSMGRYQSALRIFRSLCLIVPSCDIAWIGQGQIRMKLNDIQGAETCFQEIIKDNPRSLPALCQLGQLYSGAGRTEESAELFRLVADLDPSGQFGRMARSSLKLIQKGLFQNAGVRG